MTIALRERTNELDCNKLIFSFFLKIKKISNKRQVCLVAFRGT